jgi:hypothetical protein
MSKEPKRSLRVPALAPFLSKRSRVGSTGPVHAVGRPWAARTTPQVRSSSAIRRGGHEARTERLTVRKCRVVGVS